MIEEIRDLEPVTLEQTITIVTKEDPDNFVPKCKLTLEVILLEAGIRYVKSGHVELCDRVINPDGTRIQLKEYAMPDIETYFYYTPDKKIASLLLTSNQEEVAAVMSLDEIEKTISLSKDKEVFQAFRFLSYYWVAMQAGLSFAQQTIDIAKNGIGSEEDS